MCFFIFRSVIKYIFVSSFFFLTKKNVRMFDTYLALWYNAYWHDIVHDQRTRLLHYCWGNISTLSTGI